MPERLDWGGWIDDPPENRRIIEAQKSGIFNALTCLICADKDATGDTKKILGCVAWGFTMAPHKKKPREGPTPIGLKDVDPILPTFSCPDQVNPIWDDAAAQWNKVMSPNQGITNQIYK